MPSMVFYFSNLPLETLYFWILGQALVKPCVSSINSNRLTSGKQYINSQFIDCLWGRGVVWFVYDCDECKGC